MRPHAIIETYSALEKENKQENKKLFRSWLYLFKNLSRKMHAVTDHRKMGKLFFASEAERETG